MYVDQQGPVNEMKHGRILKIYGGQTGQSHKSKFNWSPFRIAYRIFFSGGGGGGGRGGAISRMTYVCICAAAIHIY